MKLNYGPILQRFLIVNTIGENFLFQSDPVKLKIAKDIYSSVSDLPIISPHGHCDPIWFSENLRFPNAAELFVIPDHYVVRMLVSQGISLDELGIGSIENNEYITNPRTVWKIFSENYHLFRGTPTSLWLDYSFKNIFDISKPFTKETSDFFYDCIEEKLSKPSFLPRALFKKFNIEILATTDDALSDLTHHKTLKFSDWEGRIIPTYRPDNIIDPELSNFRSNIQKLGELTGEDVGCWEGYIKAHKARRLFFKEMGGCATDHGHPSARTENLSFVEIRKLYSQILTGDFNSEDAEIFRGHMLTEMAKMSCEDGLVMQIHAGSRRNHSKEIFNKFGLDKGFDIPGPTDYVSALKPLLEEVGLRTDLTIILFTLDEANYSRELAPLAGVYPALKLGPPWWFFDSYEGIKRFREATTETCGFYNTVGFNDDTRAFCSIPARHEVARRADCAYLSELVSTGRLRESEAYEVAYDLAYGLPKNAYKL